MKLIKSRRRDHCAVGFGCYALRNLVFPEKIIDIGPSEVNDEATRSVYWRDEPLWSLNDVERYLTNDER